MIYQSTLDAALQPSAHMTPLAASFTWAYPMSAAAIPLPPLELMSRVGAPDAANFLYVCDQWAQVAGRQLRPDTHILDIGAGCGKPARAFLHHPYVVEYVGLDIDPDLVNWSNAYLRPASIHIEPVGGTASGNTNRADYTRDHFVRVAAESGWTLAALLGELAGREALLFSAA